MGSSLCICNNTSSRYGYTHTHMLIWAHICTHSHYALSVLCPGETNGTAVGKQGYEQNRKWDSQSSPSPSSLLLLLLLLSLLLGWLSYLYRAGSNLSSSCGGHSQSGRARASPHALFLATGQLQTAALNYSCPWCLLPLLLLHQPKALDVCLCAWLQSLRRSTSRLAFQPH